MYGCDEFMGFYPEIHPLTVPFRRLALMIPTEILAKRLCDYIRCAHEVRIYKNGVKNFKTFDRLIIVIVHEVFEILNKVFHHKSSSSVFNHLWVMVWHIAIEKTKLSIKQL